ncbi:MAG: hypothetical protein JWM57_2199 [Phycisphaerales bacterium]|nr:hypothetical protein [Phycisphaerales bacterium]
MHDGPGRGRTAIEGVILLLTLTALIWIGLRVRTETWTRTEIIRYVPDMENGWNWGSRAAQDGFFTLYDRVADESPPTDYGLDYMPARLAVMTLWAKKELAADPKETEWLDDYEFNRPLLQFNTFCEALTAAGLFALALDWSRRDRRPTLLGHDRPLYGAGLATIVFALVWLNPASLISAHGRPTWDVWVLPFYVWSVFAAGRGAWLTAGCIVGLGVMFKGQLLIVAPFMILWPMMRFRVGAVLRFVIGVAFSAGSVASPWLVGSSAGPIAFCIAIALLPVVIWASLKRWPVLGRSLPGRWLQWAVPLAAAIAIAACIPFFGGSLNWLRIGLIYGAKKFAGLQVGDANSLAGLLEASFRWKATDRVDAIQWIYPGATISDLLIAIYGMAIIAAAWATSRYERRGDRRFLLAVAVPWIVYFAVFPKMHERYLLWGGIVACAGLAVSWGTAGLALLFCLISTCMSLWQMTWAIRAPTAADGLTLEDVRMIRKVLMPIYPGMAWAVLMATAAWLWMTLAVAGGPKSTPVADEQLMPPN